MFEKYFGQFGLLPYMEEPGGGGGGNPPKPASFDDVLKDEEMQAEFNSRVEKEVKSALAKERERQQQLMDEKLSEAEKLSKMTELEKQKYLQDKQDGELRKREQEITRRELTAEAKNTLVEKKMPVALSEILDYSDAENCKASLTTVIEAFQEAIEAGVEERLKGGKPPKAPIEGKKSDLNEQIFNAMKGF